MCRDFAHLAITLCRCMNIPLVTPQAISGISASLRSTRPVDFSAWFEAYLGGRWYTFDARHRVPRIGRILMARGRDAADCAITTSFGQSKLVEFKVITDRGGQDLGCGVIRCPGDPGAPFQFDGCRGEAGYPDLSVGMGARAAPIFQTTISFGARTAVTRAWPMRSWWSQGTRDRRGRGRRHGWSRGRQHR